MQLIRRQEVYSSPGKAHKNKRNKRKSTTEREEHGMQNEALVTQEICSADDTRYRGESAQDTRRSFALDMVQGQQQSLQ